MNNLQKRDNAEIIADARRRGLVPISATSLRVFAFVIVAASTIWLAGKILEHTSSIISEGSLASFRSFPHLKNYLLLLPFAFLALMFALGFAQTKFFFSHDAIIPQMPSLAKNFTFQAIVSRLVTLLAIVLAEGVIGYAIYLYFFPPTIALLGNSSDPGVLLQLQTVLKSGMWWIIGLSSFIILVASFVTRMIFINANRRVN